MLYGVSELRICERTACRGTCRSYGSVTLVQVAEVFSRKDAGEDETFELVKAVYSAVGNLQGSLEHVAARVSAIDAVGQEVELVGSAVEELAGHLIPPQGRSMMSQRRFFSGLGSFRFRSQFGMPSSSLAGNTPSNAIRAGSGEAPIAPIGVPIDPAKREGRSQANTENIPEDEQK